MEACRPVGNRYLQAYLLTTVVDNLDTERIRRGGEVRGEHERAIKGGGFHPGAEDRGALVSVPMVLS